MTISRDYYFSLLSAPVVAIAAIIAAVLLAFWVNVRAADSSRLAAHSIDVRARAERVLGQIRDAETGQRGYLLTSDRSFLEPYEGAVTGAPIEADALIRAVADNPAQTRRAQEIRRLVSEKLIELKQTIDMANTDRAAALAVVAGGRGKAVMDQLRDLVRDVKLAEDDLQETRNRATEQRRLMGSVLGIAILSLLLFLGWRQISTTAVRNRELDTAKVALEERVRERTAELSMEKLRVEALLKDVSHRVGNNLAMVSALISMQGRQSKNDDVKRELEKAQARIQAIAAGQRRLRLDVDTDEVEARPYLEDVLHEIQGSVEDRKVEIALDMDDIRLPGREAISYVVLVNELVTNAIKHAFPPGGTGHIRVGLHNGRQTGDLVLQVEDDGVGNPSGQTSGGLGSQVIASLTRSMNGTVTTEPAKPGAERPGFRTTIRFVRGPVSA